ncbi:TPA: hypothetical protein ACW0T7_001281 [Enterobacter kobei]
MSNIDKQAVQAVADLKAGYTLGHADVSILNEMARIALASLEAEDAAKCSHQWSFGGLNKLQSQKQCVKCGRVELATQPAPVSVPDEMTIADIIMEIDAKDADRWTGRIGFQKGWNACRAAMLQGAVQPQNQQQNIPENIPVTQFKPVADLFGLTSATGGETSFTFDAVEARDFIEGGWSCQEYVELERFQEAMLQGADGNSTVIPDAYDIEAFGIFSATEGENGLMLQIERFRFGTEKCPQIGKENMVPKFALQGVINRLQEHCDSMGNEALVDILSTPAAPQQEVKP